MKRSHAARIGLVCLLPLLAASPALAQDEGTPDLKQQLGDMLRDFTDRVKPTLDEMAEGLQIFEEIDSFEHYARPEVLRNGDIIIRRHPDAPAYVPPEQNEPEAEPVEPGIKT
ncbi:MAG: hypothetical protein AAF415_07900 [Pseudomonadota bacterium]